MQAARRLLPHFRPPTTPPPPSLSPPAHLSTHPQVAAHWGPGPARSPKAQRQRLHHYDAFDTTSWYMGHCYLGRYTYSATVAHTSSDKTHKKQHDGSKGRSAGGAVDSPSMVVSAFRSASRTHTLAAHVPSHHQLWLSAHCLFFSRPTPLLSSQFLPLSQTPQPLQTVCLPAAPQSLTSGSRPA